MTIRTGLLLVLILSVLGARLSAAVPEALSATLMVYGADAEDRFLGSAFALGDPGTVVTNAHVVRGQDRVWLETSTGVRIGAEVVAIDPTRDLALLRPDSPLPVALNPGNAAEVGASVWAIGAPLGTGLALTAGIVSATGRQIDPEEPVRYLQHSAPVNPGSSGGPLLSEAGAVIGINTRIADGSRFFVGIAYAVPVSDILAFLTDPHRPVPQKPGLRVRALTRQIADALGLQEGQGVLVDHVVAGGPAQRAGVRAGDILLQMDGQPVTRPGDISLILARGSGARQVAVLRDGKRLTLALPEAPGQTALETMSGKPVIGHDSYGFVQMGLTFAPDGEVLEAAQGGTGFFAGITPGDHVIAINGHPVETLAPDWPDSLRIDQAALLLIRLSDGSTQHVLLDPWAKTPKLRPSSGANVLDQAVVSFE